LLSHAVGSEQIFRKDNWYWKDWNVSPSHTVGSEHEAYEFQTDGNQ